MRGCPLRGVVPTAWWATAAAYTALGRVALMAGSDAAPPRTRRGKNTGLLVRRWELPIVLNRQVATQLLRLKNHRKLADIASILCVKAMIIINAKTIVFY